MPALTRSTDRLPRAGWALGRLLAAGGAALALCAVGPARAQDAATLHARMGALQDRLAHNGFERPLVLTSTQDAGALQGDVYARLDHPFEAVAQALQGTADWCQILLLHLNTKMCHAQAQGLDLALGRKLDQPADRAWPLHLDYHPDRVAPDYLRARLTAAEGPFGTSDYRIVVEAAPLDAGRTALHLSYAYRYGLAARAALGMYLASVGADKVGFTVVGAAPDGAPRRVGGLLGLTERNTMRYYLAIESFLAHPAPTEVDARLAGWFDATERYPRQLHEIDRSDYLAMKRVEERR